MARNSVATPAGGAGGGRQHAVHEQPACLGCCSLRRIVLDHQCDRSSNYNRHQLRIRCGHPHIPAFARSTRPAVRPTLSSEKARYNMTACQQSSRRMVS